jgi:hypothetical protein
MPIKYKWILKTIVNSSDNIDPTEAIYNSFRTLRANATTITESVDVSFEINVKMEDNVITVDDLDVEGTLTSIQLNIAKELSAEANQIIKQSAGPGGRIKLKFILRS